MPALRYRLLNVFAESPFGGNPLAVVEDGRALSDADMQAVARQFNLSETAFLLPSDRAAARVRIFTPTNEMAFAGHPTLGSAEVVRSIRGAGNSFSLEMQAGLIPVHAEGGRWTLQANPPAFRPPQASDSELAAMLGLPADAVRGPALWVDCGTEQLMVPLSGLGALRACRPDPARLARFGSNAKGQVKVYAFVPNGDGFEARYFSHAPSTGLREDPATGSACASLGGWWLATEGERPLAARISQGAAVERPSLLYLDVNAGRIAVGGRVVALGAGELHW